MPSGCNSLELHEVLTAAVQSLDMSGHHSSPNAAIGSVGSIIQQDKEPQDNHIEYMDYFTHFCDTDAKTTDGPSFDVCVSVIQ